MLRGDLVLAGANPMAPCAAWGPSADHLDVLALHNSGFARGLPARHRGAGGGRFDHSASQP